MNPKKIAISQPWASRTINQNIQQDLWINKCINGILQQYNMIPSQIFIHTYPKKITLNFLLYVPKFSSHSGVRSLLKNIIVLIKSILILKYNKNTQVCFKVVPNIFHDAHILAKWIKLEKNPVRLKFILKKLLFQAKRKSL